MATDITATAGMSMGGVLFVSVSAGYAALALISWQ